MEGGSSTGGMEDGSSTGTMEGGSITGGMEDGSSTGGARERRKARRVVFQLALPPIKYTAREPAFEAWLRDHGVDLGSTTARGASEVSRGIFATEAIKRFKTLMSVPRELLVTVEMGQALEIGRALLSSDVSFEAPKHVYLALFLLVDRREQQTSVDFAPYHELLAGLTLSNFPIFWYRNASTSVKFTTYYLPSVHGCLEQVGAPHHHPPTEPPTHPPTHHAGPTATSPRCSRARSSRTSCASGARPSPETTAPSSPYGPSLCPSRACTSLFGRAWWSRAGTIRST